MTVAMINRKTRKSSKPKMAAYLKQARKGLKGFTLRWIDEDPFTDAPKITGGSVSHTNPTQRLVVGQMWSECAQWICNTEFSWLVQMDVVYSTQDGRTKGDPYEFEFTCTLLGDKSEVLNDAMESAMLASRLNQVQVPGDCKTKGTFKHCAFTARIIGV